MKKLLFIYNPEAGTQKMAKELSAVINLFTKAGYETTVYPTQSAGDGMQKVITKRNFYDRIVVAGGDGMLHELAEAVLQSSPGNPVAYIPVGTVNDFAASNNIPKNITEAAALAITDSSRQLDIGSFNDQHFSYVAAFGTATDIAYTTDQKQKNRLGVLAYLISAAKVLDIRTVLACCHRLDIMVNGQKISDEFLFGAITNSTSIGGMKNLLGNDIILDDGLLEGLFIRKPHTPIELEQMKKGLLEHDFTAPCIYRFQSEQFLISGPDEIAWTLDGEDGGVCSEVTIGVIPRAFPIIAPATVLP